MVKEKIHTIISFDDDNFEVIAKMLEIDNFKCKFCGVDVNKKNVGGFVNPKELFCKETLCLIRHIQDWEEKK